MKQVQRKKDSKADSYRKHARCSNTTYLVHTLRHTVWIPARPKPRAMATCNHAQYRHRSITVILSR